MNDGKKLAFGGCVAKAAGGSHARVARAAAGPAISRLAGQTLNEPLSEQWWNANFEWYRYGDLNPGYQDENLAS